MTRQYPFSEREKEVVEFLLQGKSNKQIALSLNISQNTVEYHLKNIYRKLKVGSRTEAVLQLGKSVGNDVSNELGKPVVEAKTEFPESGGKPISTRRIPMSKFTYVIGSLIVTTALVVLFAMFKQTDPTQTSVPTTVQLTPLLSATVSLTPTTAAVSPKEQVVEQMRQLFLEYDQAVQAEKKNGAVEYSTDATGAELFFFKDESLIRISDLYSEFNNQMQQLDTLYAQMYRNEFQPTPFPTKPSLEENRAYYEQLISTEGEKYCSWTFPDDAERIPVYSPDEGKYIDRTVGDVPARCEVWGQMLEELRVVYDAEKVNKERDVAMIRQVMGNSNLSLSFQAILHLPMLPGAILHYM